jgi:hypothetical protein
MFCEWESRWEELKGRDSESKEQCELEVYLESLAGGIGFAVACFSPCKGPKEWKTLKAPRSPEPAAKIPEMQSQSQIATHHLRHPQGGKQNGPSLKLFFPQEIVGSRRGSLLTDVCIAITLAYSQHVNCQRVGPCTPNGVSE